jgi:hypothetical protein
VQSSYLPAYPYGFLQVERILSLKLVPQVVTRYLRCLLDAHRYLYLSLHGTADLPLALMVSKGPHPNRQLKSVPCHDTFIDPSSVGSRVILL